MNTAELKNLVAKRFSAPEYGLLWEVGNSTGFGCNRHCDGLAMSLWPSRGLHLIGLDLKVSRGDWIKELKNPAKAEAIYKFCDRWYLVAGDDSIVRDGELPASWGLLKPGKAGTLLDVVGATILKPKPPPRSFLAAIFRRATEQSLDTQVVKKAVAEARESLSKQMAADHARHTESEHKTARELQATIEAFQATSGINIRGDWQRWAGGQAPDDVGRVVREVLNGHHYRDREDLERIGEIAARIVEMVKKETARGV